MREQWKHIIQALINKISTTVKSALLLSVTITNIASFDVLYSTYLKAPRTTALSLIWLAWPLLSTTRRFFPSWIPPEGTHRPCGSDAERCRARASLSADSPRPHSASVHPTGVACSPPCKRCHLLIRPSSCWPARDAGCCSRTLPVPAARFLLARARCRLQSHTHQTGAAERAPCLVNYTRKNSQDSWRDW